MSAALPTADESLPVNWWKSLAARRPPDEQIGGPAAPYMNRWWILRSRLGNIYLHQFLRSDDDRALHDHPWASLSVILEGRYGEWRLARQPRRTRGAYIDAPCLKLERCAAGDWIFRRARYAHRIELTDAPCWTLFITGPRVREWGFYCPKGWRHWRDFTNPADGGATVGRGCE